MTTAREILLHGMEGLTFSIIYIVFMGKDHFDDFGCKQLMHSSNLSKKYGKGLVRNMYMKGQGSKPVVDVLVMQAL